MPGRVVLRVMDLEPVAGEAADADDGFPGQVAAAATDGDGIAVPDGAAEFPPPQMHGVGVAAGEQAEHAGEEIPQVRVGDLPGHGGFPGLYGESAGQLVRHADSGVAGTEGGEVTACGPRAGPT